MPVYTRFALLLLFFAIAPPYAGPEACAPCHPSQSRLHSMSRHAAALRPAGAPLAALFGDRPLRERSGIEFSYEPAPAGTRVVVTQGGATASAILEWAFGAGAQAITPVGRVGRRYFEHRLSWYREPGHPARTLGHPGEPSASPDRALGIPQDPAVITRCFQCHATGVATGGQAGPRLDNMQAGVTCERCHGPGAAHAAKPDRANIGALSALPREALVEACAECHRGPADKPKPGDPANIRFQPIGLMASQCYQKSGTLSCLTCHDPHTDAATDAGFYASRCLGCHMKPAAASCPRATRQDCLPCHMPRGSPFPFLTFTDHRIARPGR